MKEQVEYEFESDSGLFVFSTRGVSVLMFGLFEGLYNHVFKNVLYVGGASTEAPCHSQ